MFNNNFGPPPTSPVYDSGQFPGHFFIAVPSPPGPMTPTFPMAIQSPPILHQQHFFGSTPPFDSMAEQLSQPRFSAPIMQAPFNSNYGQFGSGDAYILTPPPSVSPFSPPLTPFSPPAPAYFVFPPSPIFPPPNPFQQQMQQSQQVQQQRMLFFPMLPTPPPVYVSDEGAEMQYGAGALQITNAPVPMFNAQQPMSMQGFQNDRFCGLCRRNGERREFFENHITRDDNGKAVCPVLRSYVCPYCGMSGDDAHTRSYCPQRPPGEPRSFARMRLKRRAIGLKPMK